MSSFSFGKDSVERSRGRRERRRWAGAGVYNYSTIVVLRGLRVACSLAEWLVVGARSLVVLVGFGWQQQQQQLLTVGKCAAFMQRYVPKVGTST